MGSNPRSENSAGILARIPHNDRPPPSTFCYDRPRHLFPAGIEDCLVQFHHFASAQVEWRVREFGFRRSETRRRGGLGPVDDLGQKPDQNHGQAAHAQY